MVSDKNSRFKEYLRTSLIVLRIEEQLYGKNSLEIAKSYTKIIEKCRERSYFPSGIHYGEICLYEVVGKMPKNIAIEFDIGPIYLLMAYFHLELNELEHSAKYYEKYWELKKGLFTDREEASFYVKKGILKTKLGMYDEALALFDKSHKIVFNDILRGEDIDVEMLQNKARLFMAINKYGDAIACLKEAIELQEKTDDLMDMGRYDSYLLMAFSYLAQGNFKESEKYFKQTYDKRYNHYGKEEIDICAVLIGQGDLFQAQKDLKKALEYYNRALVILRRDVETENYIYLGIKGELYKKIALLNMEEGYLSEAKEKIESAAKDFQSIPKKDDFRLQESMDILSKIESELKKYFL